MSYNWSMIRAKKVAAAKLIRFVSTADDYAYIYVRVVCLRYVTVESEFTPTTAYKLRILNTSTTSLTVALI